MPIRIAIVDDHTLVRNALSELLSTESDIAVVASVGTAGDALRAIESDPPDVVLLDIALPDANGLNLIGRIRHHDPAIRVLVLTMHSESEYALAARERGASGLIAKSAPIEALVEAVRIVADGGSIPVEGALTERERQILSWIGQGASNGEIAAALDLRPKTVEAYNQGLMAKLDTHTRAGLIGCARRLGLMRRPDSHASPFPRQAVDP